MQINLKSVIHGLCLVPFVGLLIGTFVLDDWFTQGTGIGKAVFFYTMMALVPLAASVSYWVCRQPLKYRITDCLVPLFATTALFVTYLNHPIWNSKMVILVLLVVLYFSLRIVLVQHGVNRRVLLLVLMITGLVEALWGLLQLYGHIPSQHVLFRVTGSFFNPGPFAGYLASVLPVAVCYSLRSGRTVRHPVGLKRWFSFVSGFIALATLLGIALVLPATMSRAAWIAGGIGAMVVIVRYLKTYGKPLIRTCLSLRTGKGRTVWIAVVLLAGVGLAGLYYLKKDSADGRALIWKVSLNLVEKNWPMGSGLGYFSGSYGDAQQDYFIAGHGTANEEWLAGEPEYAFNEFIQIAVELGPFSLIIILVIVGYACVVGLRRGRIAEASSLIALLIFASMSYPFSLMPFLGIIVLLVASCASAEYSFIHSRYAGYGHRFNKKKGRQKNAIWVVGLLMASWVAVACCLRSQYPVFQAHKKWGEARALYQARAYEKVVERYHTLLPYLGDQVNYLFEYGQALSKIERYEESDRVMDRAMWISADPMMLVIKGNNRMGVSDYTNASMYFEKAAQRVPHRLYPYYLMARAYYRAGDWGKAREKAEYVLRKRVKVDSPAIQEMKAEMNDLIAELEI